MHVGMPITSFDLTAILFQRKVRHDLVENRPISPRPPCAFRPGRHAAGYLDTVFDDPEPCILIHVMVSYPDTEIEEAWAHPLAIRSIGISGIRFGEIWQGRIEAFSDYGVLDAR